MRNETGGVLVRVPRAENESKKERGIEREREREAEGLVKYRSEWQVRDKAARAQARALRSAAMVSKGKMQHSYLHRF